MPGRPLPPTGDRSTFTAMVISLVFVFISVVFHLAAFAMESLLWHHPAVRRLMTGRAAVHDDVRLWAFNQGFYNLFFAIGMLVGAFCWMAGDETVGRTLVIFTCASMVAAGAVLFISDRRLWRGMLAQSAPPLAAVIAALVLPAG